MSTVRFTLDKETTRYKAEFFKNNDLVDWKYLTPEEEDGLIDFLPEEEAVVDALGLYEELDNLWFPTASGEPTNFEEMLYDLVGEEDE
jgi:hypothetical protein